MTTLEALRQTVDIEEITRRVKRRRVGKALDGTKEKPSWLGACFFDDYGNAWLYIDGKTRCIGNEKDIRLACKKYNTDVENPSDIKNTVIRFARELKNQSYHLASKTSLTPIRTHIRKAHRIISRSEAYKNALQDLVKRGLGTPTIQKELKKQGFSVAYATLGRDVRRERQLVLV